MATYQVRVTSVPDDRKRAVRALRVIGRMPLAKAAELYEFVSTAGHAVVAAGLDEAVAEHVRLALEGGGIDAEVGASSSPSPMVLDPSANAIYEWSPLHTLRRRSGG